MMAVAYPGISLEARAVLEDAGAHDDHIEADSGHEWYIPRVTSYGVGQPSSIEMLRGAPGHSGKWDCRDQC